MGDDFKGRETLTHHRLWTDKKGCKWAEFLEGRKKKVRFGGLTPERGEKNGEKANR